jgi:hypothetical protein
MKTMHLQKREKLHSGKSTEEKTKRGSNSASICSKTHIHQQE